MVSKPCGVSRQIGALFNKFLLSIFIICDSCALLLMVSAYGVGIFVKQAKIKGDEKSKRFLTVWLKQRTHNLYYVKL